MKEYYQIIGQLAICDSITKQLHPFFLPNYFKMYWYIGNWDLAFHSIVEKEKVINKQAEKKVVTKQQTTHITKMQTGMLNPVANVKKHVDRRNSSLYNTSSNIIKIVTCANKLKRILGLIEDIQKSDAEKVKDECDKHLEDEENELIFLDKIYKLVEQNERKVKSNMGRRKTIEFKVDNSECKLNSTREQFENEQYSHFSNLDKVRKLMWFIENDFQNVEIENSRVLSFLESKKGEIFDSRDISRMAEIDYEVSSFFTEAVEPMDFEVIHNTLGRNPEEEGLNVINRQYSVKNDTDIDIKTILDRKTKYHKEMVKFFKLIQQTRARKLEDFLIEARNSSLSEYSALVVLVNTDNFLCNFNLFSLFIPVHQFRNISDMFYSIFLLNDFVESERKIIETEEVTPTVISDDIGEDESKSKNGKLKTHL